MIPVKRLGQLDDSARLCLCRTITDSFCYFFYVIYCSAESVVSAIRPASDAELVWFRRVQAELATDAVWASA